MANHDDHQFKGYASPNYTPVPDELFDEQLPDLSGAELKVLLYVIRRTFGFKRESDNISLSQMLNGLRTYDGRQLDRGVGLTKKTLLLAIKSLEEKQIIFTERRRSVANGDEPTSYRLHLAYSDAREIITPPVGEKLPQGGGGEITPGGWGRNYPTQDTERKTEGETDINPSNIRKRSHANEFVDNSATQPSLPYRTDAAVRDHGESQPITTPPTTVGQDDNTTDTGDAVIRELGVEVLGAILKRGRGRPTKQYDEEREMILAFIGDFAREFQDRAELRSSVTRAYNLYTQSGLSPVLFQDRMYQARSKTKERRAAIKGSRMAYFFGCLEREVGVKAAPEYDHHGGTRTLS